MKGEGIELTIFRSAQVMYPFKWACYVHQVPLVLGLSLPFLQRAALPSDSLFGLYASVALETIAALVSMACAIASCLFAAILRVTLLGELNQIFWLLGFCLNANAFSHYSSYPGHHGRPC